jgi:hypothetical protein
MKYIYFFTIGPFFKQFSFLCLNEFRDPRGVLVLIVSEIDDCRLSFFCTKRNDLFLFLQIKQEKLGRCVIFSWQKFSLRPFNRGYNIIPTTVTSFKKGDLGSEIFWFGSQICRDILSFMSYRRILYVRQILLAYSPDTYIFFKLIFRVR